MKLDILTIAAHPDDIELCCAGTLLKHMAMGYTVGMVELTRGELGTRGSGELRMQESRAAADILGIEVRDNLGMPDAFFEHNKENQLAIARIIRKYRPEVVIANAPIDRHPDHGRASKLISDACFVAGLRRVETEMDGQVQMAWRPRTIYYFIQDYKVAPDFCVDVTAYMDKRMEAVRCFRSQFYDPQSADPDSPISGKEFLDVIMAAARTFGRMIGTEFGEGFTTQKAIGVENILKLT